MTTQTDLMAYGMPAALAEEIVKRVVGRAATDTIGFYGATPIAQRASANQATVTNTTTATATTTALQTDLDAMRVLLNQIRNDLVSVGLIKGSA